VTTWWLELRARLTAEILLPRARRRGGLRHHHQFRFDRLVQLPGLRRHRPPRQPAAEFVRGHFLRPVAQKFRDELANGKIPIPTCVRCGSFRRLKKNEAPPKPRLPYRGILLENTVRCNVDCIGCARENASSLRVNKQLQMPLAELSLMADLAARLKMERIFYLNLGEPFLSPAICQELPMLREKKSRRLHPGFDERHPAQHGRQARGGVKLDRHPVFRPRHQRCDV